MKHKSIFFFLLLAIWAGLVGVDNVDMKWLSLMFGASSLTFVFALKLDLIPKRNYFKISCIAYFIWLIREIVISSVAVVKIACRKDLMIRPVLDSVKSTIKRNVGDVVYANSITLTPGTVTLSIDGKRFCVHALDKQFMDDLHQSVMESRVKGIIK